MPVRDEERRVEAERILNRLDHEGEKLTGATRPPERSSEWTERWGRRLGLILGYALALVLLLYLIANYLVR
jgi:hypothetical protein